MVREVPRGKDWDNGSGGGRFHSRVPHPIRGWNDVALELAHARDLQAADYRILAGGRHPDPVADPLQRRPRGEGGEVALEKGGGPGADEGRETSGERGLVRGASNPPRFSGNSVVANWYVVQKTEFGEITDDVLELDFWPGITSVARHSG